MKKLFSILFLLVAMSCQKLDIDSQNALVGRWEWVKSSGGLAGVTYHASDSPARYIEFSSDSVYKSFEKKKLLMESKYYLKRDESILSNEIVDVLVIEGALSQSYRIEGKILYLNDLVFDGFSHEYRKKN